MAAASQPDSQPQPAGSESPSKRGARRRRPVEWQVLQAPPSDVTGSSQLLSYQVVRPHRQPWLAAFPVNTSQQQHTDPTLTTKHHGVTHDIDCAGATWSLAAVAEGDPAPLRPEAAPPMLLAWLRAGGGNCGNAGGGGDAAADDTSFFSLPSRLVVSCRGVPPRLCCSSSTPGVRSNAARQLRPPIGIHPHQLHRFRYT